MKKSVSDYAVKMLANNLKKLMDNLGYTVIIPAGVVFTFRGLDADDTGKLCSHVSYAQGADSAKVVGDAGQGMSAKVTPPKPVVLWLVEAGEKW